MAEDSLVTWWNFAECAQTKEARELFNLAIEYVDTENELDYPTQAHKEVCNRCPVHAECLSYALKNEKMRGVWGGTTDYQRRQLRRQRGRERCPVCDRNSVVPEHKTQICLGCGTSWPTI